MGRIQVNNKTNLLERQFQDLTRFCLTIVCLSKLLLFYVMDEPGTWTRPPRPLTAQQVTQLFLDLKDDDDTFVTSNDFSQDRCRSVVSRKRNNPRSRSSSSDCSEESAEATTIPTSRSNNNRPIANTSQSTDWIWEIVNVDEHAETKIFIGM